MPWSMSSHAFKSYFLFIPPEFHSPPNAQGSPPNNASKSLHLLLTHWPFIRNQPHQFIIQSSSPTIETTTKSFLTHLTLYVPPPRLSTLNCSLISVRTWGCYTDSWMLVWGQAWLKHRPSLCQPRNRSSQAGSAPWNMHGECCESSCLVAIPNKMCSDCILRDIKARMAYQMRRHCQQFLTKLSLHQSAKDEYRLNASKVMWGTLPRIVSLIQTYNDSPGYSEII